MLALNTFVESTTTLTFSKYTLLVLELSIYESLRFLHIKHYKKLIVIGVKLHHHKIRYKSCSDIISIMERWMETAPHISWLKQNLVVVGSNGTFPPEIKSQIHLPLLLLLLLSLASLLLLLFPLLLFK